MTVAASQPSRAVEAKQYNLIGQKLNNFKAQLPAAPLILDFIKEQIGKIHGLEILDLASGNGEVSRKLHEWGAKSVTGMDISEVMVQIAQAYTSDLPGFEFSVADCSKPVEKGQFDLTTAFWLFNYATNRDELAMMWSNVYRNTKPGGRFFGIMPSFNLVKPDCISLVKSGAYRFGGTSIKLLNPVDDGVRIEATWHVATPSSAINYILNQDLHESCAAQSGMQDLRFIQARPVDMTHLDPQTTSCIPYYQVVTAVRPTI
ncbi:hypothetical protein N7507_003433 [Penicillium longicatenatum]|nr:hypothetical protein N7507_003433 [Penicillium longicatenatum]